MTRENATLAGFKSGHFGACKFAVLVPCYNEEAASASCRRFPAALPRRQFYVYDNNSTRRDRGAARAAGADRPHEARQGKGHVVRRMFADIDADIYVLVDGDDTYERRGAAR